MKEIKIKISKSAVFDDVSLNSAYMGAKTVAEEGFYDRVNTIEADSLLLSKFWTEIEGEVTDKFQEFITSISSTDKNLTLTLELSNAYDETLTASVTEDTKAAFSAGIMGRWFRFTYQDMAEQWLQKSENLLSRAFAKLCVRRPPKRK